MWNLKGRMGKNMRHMSNITSFTRSSKPNHHKCRMFTILWNFSWTSDVYANSWSKRNLPRRFCELKKINWIFHIWYLLIFREAHTHFLDLDQVINYQLYRLLFTVLVQVLELEDVRFEKKHSKEDNNFLWILRKIKHSNWLFFKYLIFLWDFNQLKNFTFFYSRLFLLMQVKLNVQVDQFDWTSSWIGSRKIQDFSPGYLSMMTWSDLFFITMEDYDLN